MIKQIINLFNNVLRKNAKKIVSLAVALCLIVTMLTACGANYKEVGLRLYLKFDEKNGQYVNDVSKNQNAKKINYVFNNAAFKQSIDPIRKKGVKGRALSFDGYSNSIEYNEFEMSSEQFSISVWIAPRTWDYPSNVVSAIANKYNKADNAGFILGFKDYGNYTFQLGLGDAGWVELWDGGDTLDKFVWTHLSATYDSACGLMTLYKNGQLVNSKNVGAGNKIKGTSEPLVVGKNIFSGYSNGIICDTNMFNGLMDELKIYDRALTDKEIRKYFNSCLRNNNMPECKFEDVWLDANILADDRYRPQFHAAPPQHWMNEAISPFYYNGKYHMFYQQTPNGPYLGYSHWGHWVSDDLVNWENLPPALAPEPNELDNHHVFSGNAITDSRGVPHIFYTGVNFGLSHLNRISVATPKDLGDPNLTEWVKHGEPIITQPDDCSIIDFRDPFMYKEDGFVYMMIGTSSAVQNFRVGNPRIVTYRASEDNLLDWEYLGVTFEKSYQDYPYLSYMWELPVFSKLKSENGIEKYMLTICPKPDPTLEFIKNDIYYFLGEFDKQTGKFVADNEQPMLFDFGANVAAGPTGFYDSKSNKNIMWSIAQDQRTGADVKDSGWANTATIAKEIGLNNDGTISINPLKNYECLRSKQLLSVNNKTVDQTNELLKNIKGDMLQIKLKMHMDTAQSLGIRVRQSADRREETVYYYDNISKSMYANTFKSGIGQLMLNETGGNIELNNGIIELEMYIDRSLIETFVNGKMCISAKAFPVLADSMGIQLFEEGGTAMVISMEVWSLNSIYGVNVPPYYEQARGV